METYYCFFDRSAVDPLWGMSWQDFLRLYGKHRGGKRSREADVGFMAARIDSFVG